MKILPGFRFTKKFHARVRAHRARMAAEFMNPSPDLSLLDVSGAPGLGRRVGPIEVPVWAGGDV